MQSVMRTFGSHSKARRFGAVAAGLATAAAAVLLSTPMAHAVTPYFTGTSTCDTVNGNEVITYAVPHPLGTFTTTDITGVTTMYTKLGTATIFTSTSTSTYPTSVAGDTLTMTVPGNVAGTYRVNLIVGITTATGSDVIVATADAVVSGTCAITPGEVLPTSTVVPTTAAPTTAAPTTAAPTTASPTTADPTTAAPTTAAPTTAAPTAATPSAAGTEVSISTAIPASSTGASGTAEAGEVETGSVTLASTGSDVDESAAILGIAALVGGAVILVIPRRPKRRLR